MRIVQKIWRAAAGWSRTKGEELGDSAHLVLAFGSTGCLDRHHVFDDLRRAYPRAHLALCSTAGEICGTQVLDDAIVATAVRFEHAHVRTACVDLRDVGCSRRAGDELARRLDPSGLRHVVVLSDGLSINGTALATGLREVLSPEVVVTGGLSGDGDRMQRTLVGMNEPPASGRVAAIGFYGDRLRVGYGSLGGWASFGPERIITRSTGNVLHELDGRPALELYKRYLGEHAKGLPATGLLLPISLQPRDGGGPVVRTVVGVSEADQSMTFAGDMPEGALARLMRASFEGLIDGAAGAARGCHETLRGSAPELALLVSCVGRKLVLKQRVEEEVEGVREVLGSRPVLAGFYSYGELGPVAASGRCELHNQTMTVTAFAEV